MAKTAGRRTKYTAELATKIVTAIQNGLSREDSARINGISPETLYRWMNRYPVFRQRVLDGDSVAVALATSALLKAIRAGDTQAAKLWLQAKRPTEWGTKQRLEIANGAGESFTTTSIDISKLSTEELTALLALAEKAGTTPATDPAPDADSTSLS